MPSPLITISIVSHGDVEKIKALLQSFFYEYPGDEYQFIITDNMGDEDYSDEIFANITLICNTSPKGFAANHNAAFAHATGQYFCVLNPDILFTDPVFKKLIGHLEADRAAILAPLLVDSAGIVQDSFRAMPTPKEIIVRRLSKPIPPEKPSVPYSPDWLAGMFLIMRREIFSALNGFDERYHFYFEDVDFGTRARLAGYRLLLEPAACAQHDAHRGSRRKLKYLLWHLRSAILFFTSKTYRQAKHG